MPGIWHTLWVMMSNYRSVISTVASVENLPD
jgi:hypothetical protein